MFEVWAVTNTAVEAGNAGVGLRCARITVACITFHKLTVDQIAMTMNE